MYHSVIHYINCDKLFSIMDKPKHLVKQYLTYLLTMVLLVSTSWIMGYGDHKIIRQWFVFTMILLLAMRVVHFYRKGYLLFFLELCYYINTISIVTIYNELDITLIYPFVHGPLMMFSIFSADAVIPHDLPRTTSYAIHSFCSIVSRRLYWTANSEMHFESFEYYWIRSFIVYLGWMLPYMVYLFMYNGKRTTMIRDTYHISETTHISKWFKMRYIFLHMLSVMIGLCVGVMALRSWSLSWAIVGVQLFSGLIQGGYYYYSDGHRLNYIRAIKNLFMV